MKQLKLKKAERKKRYHITHKGKDLIIAVLCITVVCLSTAYGSLLKKYRNIVKESNNAVGSYVTDNLEISDDSSDNFESSETWSEEITNVTTEETENMTMSDVSETETNVESEIADNAAIMKEKQQRDAYAEKLCDMVKDKQYDSNQIEQAIDLYEDENPIMELDFDFDDSEEYDIENAENSAYWDTSVSCGKLSYINETQPEKLLYYFTNWKTVGKQYVLANEGDIPDVNEIIYIEPIDNVADCYYMATIINERSHMYFVIGSKVYDFKNLYL